MESFLSRKAPRASKNELSHPMLWLISIQMAKVREKITQEHTHPNERKIKLICKRLSKHS